MKVNLNDEIWIKFNSKTDECLMKNHKDLYGEHAEKIFPYKPIVQENGWVRTQLWCMAQMFGPHMGTGIPLPIEPEIYIGEKPPTEANQ